MRTPLAQIVAETNFVSFDFLVFKMIQRDDMTFFVLYSADNGRFFSR